MNKCMSVQQVGCEFDKVNKYRVNYSVQVFHYRYNILV
jgi:hypothetical protein